MKTSDEQLIQRGFLADSAECLNSNTDTRQLLALLAGNVATDRSLAARLIGIQQDELFIEPLCHALCVEGKLYSKLEICNALVTFGLKSVSPLVELLGFIGKNQYKIVADKPFNKDSYPLPRDIAARCLIRIGSSAIPTLFDKIENGGLAQVSEAIDAVGFIHFYQAESECFEPLSLCFDRFKTSELIRWKIIRAMSGCAEAKDFLMELLNNESHSMVKFEIDRSLRLMDKKHAFQNEN